MSKTIDYRVSPENMSDKFYKTEAGALRAAKRIHEKGIASYRCNIMGYAMTRSRRVTVYRDTWEDGKGIVEHVQIAKFTGNYDKA